MRRITKLFQTKTTSIDDNTKQISFVISDNKEDRMGEIVDQKSWNFKDYLKNPILLWGHDPSEPENVLGHCVGLDTAKDGSTTTGTFQFDTDINPKADLVFNQLKRGSLRTVSVGFWNHSEERDGDTPVLKDNDLLETSVVPIPANPRAVALAFKAGELSRKDAGWLMKGMREEADYIEQELSTREGEEDETSMDEATKKQMSTLTEAITALAASQATTNERLDQLTAAIQEKGAISSSLPTADPDTAWSGADAKARVKAWASDSDGNINWTKYSKAFFWFDSAAPDPDGDGLPDKQGDYKLPYADVVDGSLKAVWNGVKAAYGAVQGARGGVDMPEADKAKVLSQIKKYYGKFGEDWPGKAFDLEEPDVHTKGADPAPINEETGATDTDPVPRDVEPDTEPRPQTVAETSDDTDADGVNQGTTDTPADPRNNTPDSSKDGDEPDSANGGDDDQPGAADGEDLDVDPDAELTPELKAQIDSAFKQEVETKTT